MPTLQAKRILIFSLTYYPRYVGGAEVAIKEITDRIAPDDIAFDMITLRLDSALPAKERIGNVMVYRVGPHKVAPSMEELVRFPMYLAKVLYPLLAAWKAFKLHRARPYDGAWAMMSYMGFPLVLLRYFFFTRIPFAVTLQEGDTAEHVRKRWRIRLFAFLYAPIFRLPVVISAISHYLAGWARDGGYAGPVEIIPNAVDSKEFSQPFSANELADLRRKIGADADDRFLVTTSRLVAKNGIDIVIRALKSLPPHIKFLILGVGPDEAKLRKLAEDEGVAGRVFFLGHIDRSAIPKYLSASEIFVRPSRSEGMGISFVEAMAAGIPVIATPVGGIVDFLFDPERDPDRKPTGLLVAVDDPSALSRAVSTLLNDGSLKTRIVENARSLVAEKYEWDMVGTQMREKVFEPLFVC